MPAATRSIKNRKGDWRFTLSGVWETGVPRPAPSRTGIHWRDGPRRKTSRPGPTSNSEAYGRCSEMSDAEICGVDTRSLGTDPDECNEIEPGASVVIRTAEGQSR